LRQLNFIALFLILACQVLELSKIDHKQISVFSARAHVSSRGENPSWFLKQHRRHHIIALFFKNVFFIT
jgi:hypothetical protein